MSGPPRPLEALLARMLDPVERDDVLGDLAELYARRAERQGRWAALAAYLWQGARHGVRASVGRSIATNRGGGMGRDVRFALRALSRKPGSTFVMVATLAVALGANTAIFSLIDRVFFSPLPIPDADRLVAVYGGSERDGEAGGIFQNFLPHSWPNVRDLAEEATTLESVYARSLWTVSLGDGEGRPERASGEFVTANYFQVLGIRPALGRFFGADEGVEEGAPPVAVLAHRFWLGRFGGDPGVVGRSLAINGRDFTVVGVGPAGFAGGSVTQQPDFWLPIGTFAAAVPEFGPRMQNRGMRMFLAGGRLRPGVSLDDARAELARIGRSLEERHPRVNEGRGLHLLPLKDARVDPNDRAVVARSGALLAGAVGLVLLIACFNVANLLLARAIGRRREMAIRTSVGASRGQLARQLLVESLVLFLLAGAVGLAVAGLLQSGLLLLQPPDLIVGDGSLDLSLDLRVFGYTAALTVVLGATFGLIPAVRASRVPAAIELRTAGDGGRAGGRLRSALVVAQVALCVVALTGTGLFLRSLAAARQIDPGWEPEGLATLSLDPGAQGYDDDRIRGLYGRVLERAASVPAVEAAALAAMVPLTAGPISRVRRDDGIPVGGEEGLLVRVDAVSPGYFETLGIPLVEGRPFDTRDRDGSSPVAIVNRTMARTYWPSEEPVGRRLEIPLRDRVYEVVGVVEDAKYVSLGEAPQPVVSLSLDQEPPATATLFVRGTSGAEGVPIEVVRREVQSVAPALPLFDVGPADRLVREALWGARTGAILLGSFGMMALLLAGLGVYGVIAGQARERTREIGLRMALGADAWNVIRSVLGDAALLVGIGTLVGLAGAVAAGRVAGSLLFGVEPLDPVTLVAVPATLAAVGLLAALLPAHRASRVDPLLALKAEGAGRG